MNDMIGKTVKAVEVQQWAGVDTFKDDVTWLRTVITFTDDTTTAFDSWDGETYEPYRYSDIDDDGHPVRLVETTTVCRHCRRAIGYDSTEGWVCPEATGDDSIWRTTCEDNHKDRIAAHEPRPIVPSLEERLAAPMVPPPFPTNEQGNPHANAPWEAP